MACSLVWACKLALLWVELRVSYRREAKASGRLASVGWVSSACTEARVSAGGRSLVSVSFLLEVECTPDGLVEAACKAS